MNTSAKNIHVSEGRLAELTQVAVAQGKTPDQLADEAIGLLLQNRRLEDLMEFGQRHTRDLGIGEDQVERLIAEVRSERQRR